MIQGEYFVSKVKNDIPAISLINQDTAIFFFEGESALNIFDCRKNEIIGQIPLLNPEEKVYNIISLSQVVSEE